MLNTIALVFCTAITLCMDGFILAPAVCQVMATGYSTTPGVMISSVISSNHSRKSTSYNVALEYAYTVDNQEYKGNCFRYGALASSDLKWATATVRDYPAGAKVPVFYNLRNPQDSLLVPGLDGSNLFLFAFMTPFNSFMLASWSARRSQGWTGQRRARLQMNKVSVFAVAMAAMGILAFISVFIVLFRFGEFHPSTQTMVIAWGVILSGGLAAALWHRSNLLSGKYD